MEQTTIVDSEELAAPEAKRLQALVGAVDLDDLAQRSPLRGRGADRFQYDVVVDDQGRRHQITVAEDVAPAELRALIAWLREPRSSG